MIRDIDFNTILNLDETHKYKIVFVLFGHSGCRYCPGAKQTLNILQEEYSSIMDAFYCDTTLNSNVISQFNITSVPFAVLIKQGEVKEEIRNSDFREKLLLHLEP